MKALIQANYEERLSRYATLLHGTEPPGLAAKLGVYAQLLRQHEIHGDRLWTIEPILYPLMLSAETDLHLAVARLLEDPRRAEGSVFAFLEFCRKNRENIAWNLKPVEAVICEGSGIQQNLAQKLRQAGVPLHIVRLTQQRGQRAA